MEAITEQIQYITNEQGERVGVLLDMASYHRLIHWPTHDAELMVGLSQSELVALAESQLAPGAQQQLDELLDRNANGQLTSEENTELDRLLQQVDQLTILKTRARYTLHQMEMTAA